MLTPLRLRLTPLALEAEFRAKCLESDKRVVTGLAIVAIVFLVVSFPSTFVLRPDVARLNAVWAIRAVVVGLAVAMLFSVRRVDASGGYDTLTTGWLGVWFVGVVAENALLPPEVTSFVAWDVFLTVAVYSAMPLPIMRQAALAALLSCGDLIVLWTLKSPDHLFNTIDVTLAYVCANTVGVFMSRELHGWRRRAFVALRDETAAKEDLENALREVKTLQGILPICSFCKNIRTEVGDWQQLEEYVHAHSDAEFSHGVCPDCMRLHYPGVVVN